VYHVYIFLPYVGVCQHFHPFMRSIVWILATLTILPAVLNKSPNNPNFHPICVWLNLIPFIPRFVWFIHKNNSQFSKLQFLSFLGLKEKHNYIKPLKQWIHSHWQLISVMHCLQMWQHLWRNSNERTEE